MIMRKAVIAIAALVAGLTLMAGPTAAGAAASKPQTSQKSKWKKPHGKKAKG
jgi:hypothetical protein